MWKYFKIVKIQVYCNQYFWGGGIKVILGVIFLYRNKQRKYFKIFFIVLSKMNIFLGSVDLGVFEL